MNQASTPDQQWMRHAISLAQGAAVAGEVPVGAVLVKDGLCIGEGWNQPIANNDPTAHAEIIAIRRAGLATANYRITNTTLYVTLEPCLMCLGAIAQARVKRLVFGAFDAKCGAVCSAVQLADAGFLQHKIEWQGGVLEAVCADLLRHFFKLKRAAKLAPK